jgi:DNA-binding CsgD family transcriptional regulator
MTCFSSAQEIPPIQIFTSQDYNAENQNWDISQSLDKTIYIANNKGLLEFNGANWQLYPSPNQSIMRSVKVVKEKIYSGYYMEFGYWQKNELGTLSYMSLSKNLDLIEDEQFWTILELDHWILFHSLNRIYIYNANDETFDIIDSETNITNISKVDDAIYIQRVDDGLYKIENGRDILISNDAILQNNIIVNIFSKNNGLLIQTQDAGIFELHDANLRQSRDFSSPELQNISVYASMLLKDNSYVLGTISNGIIHLSDEGDIVYQINQNEGLSNNTVLSILEDIDGNIWLGLDNGVNCLNINSPFKIYNDEKGILGTVYTSAIHQNNLYLGTNQGLFYKSLEGSEDFKFIEGTQGQVWCLTSYENELFCGHNFGTFLIENNKAVKVSNVQGTWSIRPIKNNPNLLLQGNYNGLNIIERNNDSWRFRNKIEGFDISSRFFEFINLDEIIVSHEYKGIFRINVNSEFTEVLNVNTDSIHTGSNSSLLKYRDTIYYAYNSGVFKFNPNKNDFIKDSVLSTLYSDGDYISGKLIADEENNKLWTFTNTAIKYITPGKLSQKPELNEISLSHSQRNSVTSYENILPIDNQNYLFGTSSGFIVVNLHQNGQPTYSIALNSVKNGSVNKGMDLVNKSLEGDFVNKQNTLEFTYSIPEFNKFLKAEYQYQLEGIYDDWSSWSTSSTQYFPNLSFGNYTFKVRARVGDVVSDNIESYSFTIGKPWYWSNIAVLLYVLGFVIFSFTMHTIYKNYYKRQREKLIYDSEQELALKELENQQQLMRFKNENLEKDVESKSRELAISTMSLIKKNEFLNTIKEELKKSNGNQEVNKVIKIIDRSINNTDDWKLFEEAFNNADKDFLKIVKGKHESLTPNDLRLCAYLRLNLSSKEIAPLLNISPRSVEVKRYRLRKKMNLAHETSLTNYILEL